MFSIDFCGDCNVVFLENADRLNCTGCDTYYCNKCAEKHIESYRADRFHPDEYRYEDFLITTICHCLND